MFDKKFFLLQKNKIRRILSIFKRGNWVKALVISGTVLLFLSLSVAVFFYSYESFRFLNQYPKSSEPIVIYSLAITFILTSLLTLVSSLITSLGSFFQKDDNILVFSLPIKTETVFESRLLDTILLGSWPMFVFALPLTLGFGLALRFNPFSIFVFLFGLLFLTLLATLAGAILSLAICYTFGNIKTKILGILLILSIPFLAWSLIKLLLPPALLINLETLSVREIAALVRKQTLLANFLPTTWLVNLVFFWQDNPLASTKNLTKLLGGYLGVLTITWTMRDKFYLKCVNKTAVGKFIAGPWDKTKKTYRKFPYFLPGKWGALIEKDWLGIFRSTEQVFQLVFIVFWEIVYFLVISQVPLQRVRKLFPHWYQKQLLVLNFLFINYFASVLAIRFFFPLTSLEGQSSWIIWSAPFKRTKVFWQKFFSSTLILFAWLVVSSLILNQIINGSRLAEIILLNLPVSLTLIAATFGVGAIKPNFLEKNPEKLSTSPGGILATTVCLIYIGIVSLVLFNPEKPQLLNTQNYFLIWLFSLLIITPILFSASRKINE